MIKRLTTPPTSSLLNTQLTDKKIHHQDTFTYTINAQNFADMPASQVLMRLLENFLAQPPKRVTQLMRFRNFMVKPFGLRTSELGCLVSSLNSKEAKALFNNRFPVLDQRIDPDDLHAQVILGANDKHLIFRSCVGVKKLGNASYCLSLGTKVHCLNAFGRFYRTVIDSVHQRYVSPKMLKSAGDLLLK